MTLQDNTSLRCDPPVDSGCLENRDRAGNGEDCASKEVFGKYYDRLVRLVSGRQCAALQARFDGEDVVQSTLRTFFMRVRTGRLTVDPGEDLWTLLSLIALRKLAAHARKNLADRRSVRSEARQASDAGDPPEPIAASDDEAARDCRARGLLRTNRAPRARTLLRSGDRTARERMIAVVHRFGGR
ncbi:MAG: hypothetical protein DCC68_05480 [Planctomycetota bacterium]|nr:MAG: hypothetical protein DCC68_05480 [Planctomycetota bacterium]